MLNHVNVYHALYCQHMLSGKWLYPKRHIMLGEFSVEEGVAFKNLPAGIHKSHDSYEFVEENICAEFIQSSFIWCEDVKRSETGILSGKNIRSQTRYASMSSQFYFCIAESQQKLSDTLTLSNLSRSRPYSLINWDPTFPHEQALGDSGEEKQPFNRQKC